MYKALCNLQYSSTVIYGNALLTVHKQVALTQSPERPELQARLAGVMFGSTVGSCSRTDVRKGRDA